MVRFTYRKGIQIEQQWFTDNKVFEAEKGTKILIIHGLDEIDNYNGKIDKQLTLITDLTKDSDKIYSNFKKNTRYEVRKAEKEGAEYKAFFGHDITDSILEAFGNTFSRMYESKGIKKNLNNNLINVCIKKECFVITVGTINDISYVYHSYLFDENNARLYQSCSLFRDDADNSKIIGIVNKGLHWHDMQLFKQMGIKKYDWGG